MVSYCAAYNCGEKSKKGGIHSFHSFPKDNALRKKWIIAVRRKNFKPSNTTVLCSKHFTEECYHREAFGRAKLKKDAVPTLFDFPSHVGLSKRKPRKPPKLRENLSSSVNSSPSFSITNEVIPEAEMDVKPPLPMPLSIQPSFPTPLSTRPSLSTPSPETQCPANNEIKIKLENVEAENIDELENVIDCKNKPCIDKFDSTDMASPTKAVGYYALTIPLSIQPSLSMPLSILPSLSMPFSLQPSLAVPLSTQPSLSVPLSTQPSLSVALSTQPSLSTPLSETQCQEKNVDKSGKVMNHKRKSYIGDFDSTDMTSPTEAVRYYKLTKEKIWEQNTKIKILRSSNERLKLKVENLTSLLKAFLEKNLINDDAAEILKEILPENVQGVFTRMKQSIILADSLAASSSCDKGGV